MCAELSKKELRFVDIFIVGIIVLVIGLATIFTKKPVVYILIILVGVLIIIVSIIVFIRTQRKDKKLNHDLNEKASQGSIASNNIDEIVTNEQKIVDKKGDFE